MAFLDRRLQFSYHAGMDNATRKITSAWPTLRALADDLAIPESRVKMWRHYDRIPARYWAALVDAARLRGITLSVEELAEIARGR